MTATLQHLAIAPTLAAASTDADKGPASCHSGHGCCRPATASAGCQSCTPLHAASRAGRACSTTRCRQSMPVAGPAALPAPGSLQCFVSVTVCVSVQVGAAVIVEDTSLCFTALGGLPGGYSPTPFHAKSMHSILEAPGVVNPILIKESTLLHLPPVSVVQRAGGVVPQSSLKLCCVQIQDVLAYVLEFSVQHEPCLSDGLCNIGLPWHLDPASTCRAGPYCKWFLKKPWSCRSAQDAR